MIITKQRQLLYRQKGAGIGPVVLYGDGIFTDTMKMLAKKLWVAGKTLFKQKVLPNLKAAAKHGIESGKQLIHENKKEIGKVISDQSKNLLKNLLERPSNAKDTVKETLSDTKTKVSDIINKNKETLSQYSKETLDKLLYGEGLKRIRNRKK